ncbi:GntR family transcriptional regulator [Catenulispora yoronensis]|uniref:GntR family transcriptional regulator n=1 Tax=Catenulispora yoronensis TaxID=450799 RepID=A0ABN2X4S1_9ACTN
MPIDSTDPRSPSVQIADHLREEIVGGVYGPGDKIPSERELSDEWDVSPQTIRQAIAILKNEGLVEGQPGRGVFVRTQPPLIRLGTERFSRAYRAAGKSAQQADAEAAGLSFRQEALELADVPAPADVAELLAVAAGATVFKRYRREFVDEKPNQLAASYYRLEDVEGTAIRETKTGPGGSMARLEDVGFVLTEIYEEWGPSRMPNPRTQERRLLQLSKGVPVAQVERRLYGYRASAGETEADERVLEVFQSIINGAMIKFTHRFRIQ